jgi:pimeloyl-ACP methyl ester carboxylesterase
MTKDFLKSVRAPPLIMPGNNAIHPRGLAQQLHQLVPNSQWAEVAPHSEAPDRYVRRVLQFVAEVEARNMNWEPPGIRG